ncbi:MAG: hypothetical protein WCK02_17355 [Bacteroidota bacterium]
MIRVDLTKEDRKELNYNFRPAILLPSMLLVLVSSVLMVNYYYIGEVFFVKFLIESFILLFLICFLIFYLIIRKVLLDLRNGEKVIITKVITHKKKEVDYEAGSGKVGHVGIDMKPFDKYIFDFSGEELRVEKEIFDCAKEGDEINLHFAPITSELLKVELKK